MNPSMTTTTAPITIHAQNLDRCTIQGDVMLTPRTWLRDAQDAGPVALIWIFWAIGLGLTAGAAAPVAIAVMVTAR